MRIIKVKNIVIDSLAILAIALIPHTGIIPNFGYSIPLLLLVWLVLRFNKETFCNIGFRWKSFSWHALLIGTLAGIAVFCFNQLLFLPILDYFVSFQEPEIGINTFLKQNIWTYLFILIMGWIIGGFYEEIVFHGFIFTRLEKMIPGNKKTLWSFLITAIIFGLYHIQMGPIGVINAFIAGIAYHSLALYFDRNLWYSIICHGVYNAIVITTIYMGYLQV